MPLVTRKCFVSYHHDNQDEVSAFVRTFHHEQGAFTGRGLGLVEGMAADIVDSNDTDYVMRRIREVYLRGSSVTLVMLGNCTWSRRYVDWEIQASLRQDRNIVPNGLLAIKLPSFREGTSFPDRLEANLLGRDECFARWISYPTNTDQLVAHIEAAYQRRSTHAQYIVNSRDRYSYNRNCTRWI
ncbi:TIR domain-containing protein [Mesorhizobium sp. B2-1-8]|uniref:TIR domain-containing protein n=1 Tax=Mesorhizobium sp. B2-1-8 TaxID=2589967 RepID=UPI00112A32D5|nr:TIR domain-containing protein [Mesorhizobium sp. B2-1-8]